MQTVYTTGTSSISHTYGNITAIIKEHIIERFNEDFFKYIHVSTQMAFRHVRSRRVNSKQEIFKRVKPYLIIRPIVDIPDSGSFLRGTVYSKNIHDMESGIDRISLNEFIKDVKNGYSLKYKMNRDSMSFDVSIHVNTMNLQMDLFKNMENMIVWDIPFYIKTSVESMIPRSIVRYISKLLNTDIDDGASNVPLILEYLRTVSVYPITYKIKNASSVDEFFLYYNTNLIVTYTDLDKDSGSKKNMADDEYIISFKVTVEFNTPAQYVLIGESQKQLTSFKLSLGPDSDNPNEYIPMYTYSRLFDELYYEGYKHYISTICRTNKEDDGKEDTTNMTGIFTENVLQIIKQHIYNKVALDNLFKCRLIRNNTVLTYGTDWSLDWNTMNMKIHEADHFSTYRFIVYVNSPYLSVKLEDNIENNDKTYSDINRDNKSI